MGLSGEGAHVASAMGDGPDGRSRSAQTVLSDREVVNLGSLSVTTAMAGVYRGEDRRIHDRAVPATRHPAEAVVRGNGGQLLVAFALALVVTTSLSAVAPAYI